MTLTIDTFRKHTGREPTEVEKTALLIMACHDDPNLFNNEVLGRTYYDFETKTMRPAKYWDAQKKICRSIVKYKNVIVPTGHSVGKSFLAAGLILWWLYTRPNSLIIVTAPSQNLVGSVVFKELRRAKINARIPLAGEITNSPKVSPQTLSVNNMGWHVLGIATRGMERISGQHAGQLFVVVDEASGVEDEIWEAIDSLNATKTVVFGNPIRAEGRFRDLDRRARREQDDPKVPDEEKTVSIRIPSTDSPDINKPRSPRGLADRGFINQNKRQYGEHSLWWRSRILAIFPDVSVDTLIPEAWIDACAVRPRRQGEMLGHRYMGVDLSEGCGRDRAVILIRDDLGILDIFIDNLVEPRGIAEHIVRKKFQWGLDEPRIIYDVSGPYGKDLARYLEALKIYGATPYSGSLSGGPDFANLRSLAGWRVRLRLDPDTTLEPERDVLTDRLIPNSPRQKQPQFLIPRAEWFPNMREELAALKYELHGSRTKLEPKVDLMERLGRSPDLADSLMMSFAFVD